MARPVGKEEKSVALEKLFWGRKEHQNKANQEKEAGKPDGTHSPARDQKTAQPGSQGKDKDDPKIVERAIKEFLIMGHMVMG